MKAPQADQDKHALAASSGLTHLQDRQTQHNQENSANVRQCNFKICHYNTTTKSRLQSHKATEGKTHRHTHTHTKVEDVGRKTPDDDRSDRTMTSKNRRLVIPSRWTLMEANIFQTHLNPKTPRLCELFRKVRVAPTSACFLRWAESRIANR